MDSSAIASQLAKGWSPLLDQPEDDRLAIVIADRTALVKTPTKVERSWAPLMDAPCRRLDPLADPAALAKTPAALDRNWQSLYEKSPLATPPKKCVTSASPTEVPLGPLEIIHMHEEKRRIFLHDEDTISKALANPLPTAKESITNSCRSQKPLHKQI